MKDSFSKIDKPIFFGAVLVTLALSILSIMFSDKATVFYSSIFNYLTNTLGFTFVWFTIFIIIFCLYIALSKYGNIRLGADTDRPAYSNISWLSMIFAAGMGIGLVFWSVAEPLNHFFTSPTAQSGTAEAAIVSLKYTFFHWGIHPWTLYIAVALPMGYFHFRHKQPMLISSCFRAFLGEKSFGEGLSRGVDTFTIILTLVGIATSFGLGCLQIESGLKYVFGFSMGAVTPIVIVIICAALFTLSASVGIDRGMKFISNANTAVMFLVMFFVLLTGPTLSLIKMTTESVGVYFSDFVRMSFFTDAGGTVAARTGFNWVGGWTIFYWVWWTTWTPFVGGFMAQISKGRTLREFILSVMLIPMILSCIWFGILGGTALQAELAMPGSVVPGGAVDTNSSIFAMLSTLPMSQLISVLVMISLTIFFLTSADAGVQVVSVMSSKGQENSGKALKVLWGVILALLAIMFVMTGGLSTVQSLSFVFSFPFMIIIFLMLIGLFKFLSKHEQGIACDRS
ncbi:MAG: BCCT family transporter [Synergistaceae bacterium]|jgi:glycine betaine transporter|nr:BCCT family transporter [Synergistaceae bacterium]